jgi:CubicO group peptidase (beta-lactamase class C family)
MTVTPEDVQDLLVQQCQTHGLPGASVAFLHDGHAQFLSCGVTDVNHPRAVTQDTLFGIGSTSKTLTGTAMIALVEQGKVALDDRVVKHLPDLPILDEQARDLVTVGQLLDHTAGWIGDADVDTGWGDDALAQAVPVLLGKAPQLCPPGTLFSYNNTAVNVAGLLVARLYGSSFEDAVRDLVLAPLGMTSTHFLVWDIANRPHATGHIATADGPIPVPTWVTTRSLGPAGGAFSTARDVMTYARFHLTGETDGKGPISEESRLLMQQQRSSCRSGFEGAGVSWLLGRRGRLRLIEHGGNLSNLMVSTFSMAPEVNLALSVMGNAVAGSTVGQAIRDFLLDEIAGRQEVATTPVDQQPSLDEYLGIYAAGQWDIEVIAVDGQLDFGMRLTDVDIADQALREVFESKRTRVTFVAHDLVAVAASPATPVGDFVRDDAGRISFFRTGGRLARRNNAS